jgi:ABC-type branched-subunit amino acid transport system ATPase component
MLTRIQIRNFKRLRDADVELGDSVVLIGPNNTGKTTALQAITLWGIGVQKWRDKRASKSTADERSGVAISRNDLFAIPVPTANLLWHDLHTRSLERKPASAGEDKPKLATKNIRIDIVMEGIAGEKAWKCGLEFDYANTESLYVRPLRLGEGKSPARMEIPVEATQVQVAYLPPMSGLADREFIKQPEETEFLIGQGQTAQVLRNLVWRVFEKNGDRKTWGKVVSHVKELFGVRLHEPRRTEHAEIQLEYEEKNGTRLDLSCSGRGLQQTLLLLVHLYANPRTVLLLDEPDAHLEVLRQRQIYQLLTNLAADQGSQIVAASHSEAVLNEAAEKHIVLAFVGKPHRIDDRGTQVRKALLDYGYDHYYQAEQCGWVLYVEGSTDLAILQAFAKTLEHKAQVYLERPFVHYVFNQPPKAAEHFYALREAKSDLVGLAIFDHRDRDLPEHPDCLSMRQWSRCEIENYLCMDEVLVAYARHGQAEDDLIGQAEIQRREKAMRESIDILSEALKVTKETDPWAPSLKVTDEFLDPLFKRFYKELQLPNLMSKTNYHVLASLVPKEKIDPEVSEMLDAICAVAAKAKPLQTEDSD